jgi:DNA polymerase I-like protein with 3'-5' exonuclease and polymerase domains
MKSILFHITNEDVPYLGVLKSIMSGKCQCFIDRTQPNTMTELWIKSKAKGTTHVVSTSQELLRHVLAGLVASESIATASISNYAGSILHWSNGKGQTLSILFVDPLANLVTTNTGKFILDRYLSKILLPENWLVEPEFKWELFSPDRLLVLQQFFASCTLIAIDIETRIGDENRIITCISFCGARFHGTTMTVMNTVIPMDSEFNIEVCRIFTALPPPKILQNGKYDIAYLLRYNCPITNYAMDTINLFHSWLSELPKDLGFISSFMCKGYVFHKNEGKTGNILDYYAYNAKDTFYTLLVGLALLKEIPKYAYNNFLEEFPLVFPCILSEATGVKYDSKRAEILLEKVEKDTEEELRRLRIMVASPSYNPGSSQQTVKLFAILGSKDITSSGKAQKDRVATRHPINKRIVDSITSIREGNKLRSSYFKPGVSWKGRCFYALNPHGTDTGRLASRESQFWCGLQIQNIPREGDAEDVSVKECFIADDGFFFGEADYSQAEARDTAYLSGDVNLIAAVDDPTMDFHGRNASAFFGIPYDQIIQSTWDTELNEYIHKTLNKPIRQISKNTNHGANYNMGAQVMIDTMGISKVLEAKHMLKLPAHYTLLQVTGYLLDAYAKRYPTVKGAWYDKVKNDIRSTGLLVGPTGWTRRCFGKPWNSKQDLNAAVAHPPQSLNAKTLNKAYLAVFQTIYLANPFDFKLCAQVHDSILFQYRIGREDLLWKVQDAMIIPTTVKDTYGITRVLTVPVDMKGAANRWSDVKSMKRQKGNTHAPSTS